jgi:hypothetical protein
MDWMDLAQDRVKRWALVNTVMNLHIPQNAGEFSSDWANDGVSWTHFGWIIIIITIIDINIIIIKIIKIIILHSPITVAVQSKAWTVFVRSNIWVVGSNPTQGKNVCVRLFSVCVVLRVGRGLATGWSPVPMSPADCVEKITKLKNSPGPNKKPKSQWRMI